AAQAIHHPRVPPDKQLEGRLVTLTDEAAEQVGVTGVGVRRRDELAQAAKSRGDVASTHGRPFPAGDPSAVIETAGRRTVLAGPRFHGRERGNRCYPQPPRRDTLRVTFSHRWGANHASSS